MIKRNTSAFFIRLLLIAIILCIDLVVSVRYAFAQNYPFREYSVLDGLPQSQARGLYQDRRGFLWVMTRNGISRFDGREFKNYFRKDGLPTSVISQVFEDNKGYIWVLSSKGLSKYDGYRFIHYPLSGTKPTERISYIDNPGDTIRLLLKDDLTQYFRVVWFREGVYFDHPSTIPVYDTLKTTVSFYNGSERYFLFLDSRGNVWKWYNYQITRLQSEKMISIMSNKGQPLLSGHDGNYYMLSGDLIVPYILSNDKREGRAVTFETDKGTCIRYFDGYDMNIINPPAFASWYIDDESNLWLGSEVNLYKLLSTAFRYIGQEDGFPKDTWAIVEDKNGHVWFGTLKGDLFEFDGERLIPRNEFRKLFNKQSVAFYKGSIRASDGNVYFSLDVGVVIWDGTSFRKLQGIPEDAQVCIIYEDPADKSLFFGTGNGLYHLKDGKMEYNPDFTPGGYGIVEGILRDESGKYWFSGENGITSFDGERYVPHVDSIMPSGYTYTLIKDNRGGIWITSEEGLYFKDHDTGRLSYGLPEAINTSANSIIAMDSSHILVGRMTDICIINTVKFYNKDRDYFRIYDSSFGFTGSECLDNGIIKDIKGRFWILTSGKAVLLDPEKLRPNLHPPKVIVTDIEYETDSLAWKSLQVPGLFYNSQKDLMIKSRNNNLRFHFAGISMTNPEKVLYAHRLVGHENIWSDSDPKREVEFKNLAPGNYIFQVKAFNADGIESEKLYELHFTIIPGFFQTWFFRVSSVILIISLIILITRRITKYAFTKKQEEIRIRNELSRLQMNSVLRQFDPHFTFNVISSVGSLIMKGEKETSYNYMLKLSGLLRTILADKNVLVRTLSEEIDFVRRYCDLQKLRFRERLTYSVDIGENVDQQRLIPKMTIQTFVENSIKHGIENKIEGGNIIVKITETNRLLEIYITDNGIGRKPAASIVKGGGYGLKTINSIFDFTNRINRLKASIGITDLTDAQNNPCGTQVRIIIPEGYIFDLPHPDN